MLDGGYRLSRLERAREILLGQSDKDQEDWATCFHCGLKKAGMIRDRASERICDVRDVLGIDIVTASFLCKPVPVAAKARVLEQEIEACLR